MSSSYRLNQRYKFRDQYSFQGQYYGDHYVSTWGECHPDFDAHVLGDNPDGVKVCVRRFHDSNTKYGQHRTNDSMTPENACKLSEPNRKKVYIEKCRYNLYDPRLEHRIQDYEPYHINTKIHYDTNELIEKDYIYRNRDYKGIGI